VAAAELTYPVNFAAALVEELDQVALALLVSAQRCQVGGELRTCAQSLVTVPDFDEQGGDLLIDRIAGLRPQRLDRAQVICRASAGRSALRR